MEMILLAKLRGGNWPCRDADKLNFSAQQMTDN
jgi:hypothetical protein